MFVLSGVACNLLEVYINGHTGMRSFSLALLVEDILRLLECGVDIFDSSYPQVYNKVSDTA